MTVSRYALVENGLITYFFETDGDITQMFHPSLIFVNVDAWPAAELGWIAEKIDGVWSFRPWTISAEEILRINTLNKVYQRSLALEAMAMSLVDCKICYYDNTPATQLAKDWQQWYLDWDSVDLTVENAVFPSFPVAQTNP